MPADSVASSPLPTGTPAAASDLRTFLIADVRGYTHFTQERGDAAAAHLAARFAALVQEGVAARGGQLLELRGDQALVVFGSVRQALHAALALQARFAAAMSAEPTLPLRVGMGLEVGEALPVAGGYRGRAPNLAALPVPLTPFVGRTREVAAVCGLLRRPEVRLLTLVGAGAAARHVWRCRSPQSSRGCTAMGSSSWRWRRCAIPRL